MDVHTTTVGDSGVVGDGTDASLGEDGAALRDIYTAAVASGFPDPQATRSIMTKPEIPVNRLEITMSLLN